MNLTQEQRAVAGHPRGAFVEACPGAGKTRAIVARVARIAPTLGPSRGVAVLSFTNSAIDEFAQRCRENALDVILRFPHFVSTFDGFLRHFLFAPGGVAGVNVKPVVVDSWDTLGIDVRLGGQLAFAGEAPSLDLFNAADNRIDPAAIGMQALRDHVTRNRLAYERGGWSTRRAAWTRVFQRCRCAGGSGAAVPPQRLVGCDGSSSVGTLRRSDCGRRSRLQSA